MMLKLNQLLICFLAVLLLQLPFNAHANKTLLFNYLTSKDDLSNNFVTSILEDSKGYLWFGTSDGLNKWNGYEMEVFRYSLNDTNSISDNFINCLAEDQQHNIWIGTNQGGLARYNYTQEKFYRYKADQNSATTIRNNFIRKIEVDINQTVWIATDMGLSRYIAEKDLFEDVNLSSSVSDCDVVNIYNLPNNQLLFQTSVGLFSYNTTNKLFSPFTLPGLPNPAKYDLNKCPLCFTSDNNLWIGSEGGLICYNLNTHNYELYYHHENAPKSISSNDISVIFEDNKKNIWLGTKNGGLNLYNKFTNDFQPYKSGNLDGNNLSDNIISTIYEDSYHNIWVGTQEGGLTFYNDNRNRYTHFRQQPSNTECLRSNKIGAIFEDASGRIWVGAGDGWLHELHEATNSFDPVQLRNESISPIILGIAEKNDHEFYITGWGIGFYAFNTKTRKFTEIQGDLKTTGIPLGLNGKGLGKDSNGNLWLATHHGQGLVVYNEAKNVFYDATNPGPFDQRLLKVPYAVSILQDSKQRIWILSYTGLYMFDGEYHEFKSSAATNSLSSSYIYALCETADSSIWIGNSNGLDKLVEKDGAFQFERYSSKFNLPNNIKSIVEDNKGILWISSNQGIFKFNPATNEYRNFNINKELPNQEFTERSCLKSSTGEIFFGGTNGLIKFYPDSLENQRNAQKIYISDFQIFNKSQKPGSKHSPLKATIAETKHITLSYRQSVISFEFEILELGRSGILEYAYIMEGFDDDWNYVGSKRFATYTNLSPGDYVFRVKPASGNKIEGNSEARVTLTITPPFWRTIWAYLAYVLFFILMLYLFRRSILNREKLKNELNLEKVKIKNVSETNLMKLRFFTNISHEFRTPLTLIKAPVEKLIEQDTDLEPQERIFHYNLIQKNTQKLLNMVNQLLDYRKLEAGGLVLEPSQGDVIEACRNTWSIFKYLAEQKNIKYEFTSSTNSSIISFDADKLEKILSNLLSNAFKNTPSGGYILFSIVQKEQFFQDKNQKILQISVKDTGTGIPEKDLPHIFDRFYRVSKSGTTKVEGTGIGLTLVKELTELHHGTINVNSTEDVGSEFIVTIPIDIATSENKNASLIETRAIENPDKQHYVNEVIENKISGQQLIEKQTILLVDDDEELRSFLKHELEKDYIVHEAQNGEEGLQKVIFTLPNIVISDITMPLVDGIELCNSIKTDDRTSHIPVILLTARHAKEKEIEGFESGADAYVVKPFNVKVLRAQIENLLKVRKDLIEKFQKGTSLYYNEKGVESKDKQFIQKTINIILENISNEKINAEFIANQLFVSRSVVYLKIEALAGQSVNEFIRNIRLKKSIQLLNRNEQTINEIGDAVGFNSHSYFTRSFTRQFGCSPKDYLKKLNRNENP